VTQKKTGGNLHVVLGTWLEWRVNTENNALRMMYTDGNLCSSGKHRQTTVHLICDPANAANSLSNVAEPEICAYELDFLTPFACLTGFPAEGNEGVSMPLGISLAPITSADRAGSPEIGDAATTTVSVTPTLGSTDLTVDTANCLAMKSCLDKLIPALERSENVGGTTSRTGRGGPKSTHLSGLAVLKSTADCNAFRAGT